MTTKAAHTPAPWSVSIDRDKYDSSMDDIRVLAEEERNHPQGPLTVAQVNQHLAGESVANAHLIAAAPEMLEALRAMVSRAPFIDQSVTEDGLANCEALLKARRAIRHAEGEQ